MNAHYVSFCLLALCKVLVGKGKWRGQGRGEFLPQGSYKLAGEYIHKKMFSNDSGGIWLKVRMNWQIVGSVGHGLSNQNPMGGLWKWIPESYLESFWFCRSKVGPDNLDFWYIPADVDASDLEITIANCCPRIPGWRGDGRGLRCCFLLSFTCCKLLTLLFSGPILQRQLVASTPQNIHFWYRKKRACIYL